MPRRQNPVPKYRLHKQSGQAIVTIRLPDGSRRDVLLGRYGSPESKAEYERILAELRVAPDPAAALASAPPPDVSVNELLLAFWRFAQRHYLQPDGSHSSEVKTYRLAFRPVRELYGHTAAREFGPLALKAVRRTWVDAGLSRSEANRRAAHVRRAWKWGASEQLVPVAAYQALATVQGLQRGRCDAPEPDPVGPVAEADVRAVLPFVRPEVAGMIEVQLLSGMRPGEVCQLRPRDVDASGAVWLYRPAQHKTAWRGKPRVVAIGPKAQAVLKKFWPVDPAAFVFSPARAVAALHAGRSEKRVTPLYPSHASRNQSKRVKMPTRPPAERYTASSYGHATARGVERANRARAKLPPGFVGPPLPPVPVWYPNRLRHAHATEVRRRYGLEAAGAALGHARLSVTELYAQKNLDLAVRVAAELG